MPSSPMEGGHRAVRRQIVPAALRVRTSDWEARCRNHRRLPYRGWRDREDRSHLPQHRCIRQRRIAVAASVGATGAVYGLLGAVVSAILRNWPVHEAPSRQVSTTWYWVVLRDLFARF